MDNRLTVESDFIPEYITFRKDLVELKFGALVA